MRIKRKDLYLAVLTIFLKKILGYREKLIEWNRATKN
jgi:hypothetical protein